jgi:hypothetical protein
LHHFPDIDADFLEFQPVTFSLMLGETDVIGRNEKRFAWNAPNVKTGTAKDFTFVDYRGVKAKLGSPNCSGVSGRATAKNDQIERGHAAMVDRKKAAIKVVETCLACYR